MRIKAGSRPKRTLLFAVVGAILCFGAADHASAPPGKFPEPVWQVKDYTGIQDCRMARDAKRVLAVEANALHVFDSQGRETATVDLPFTEIEGISATPDAGHALIVGWDRNDSRAMLVRADGQFEFNISMPGDQGSYFERGAITPDGSTAALLVAVPEDTPGEEEALKNGMQYSIKFLKPSGEVIWQTESFDGLPSMSFVMTNDLLIAGPDTWMWKSRLVNHSTLALTLDATGALGGSPLSIPEYSSSVALKFFAGPLEVENPRTIPSEAEALVMTPSGRVLYAESHGFHLLESNGDEIWQHAPLPPNTRGTMDISDDGRIVALSYFILPYLRPPPREMSDFNRLRFSHEFYVFDIRHEEPRWSLLPENTRLTTIRLSANGNDWILCGDNEIAAYHYIPDPLRFFRGLGRRVVKWIYGNLHPH
ncbi:MAG: hypothetical protein ACREJQ_07075 [bacterium]